MKLINGDGGIVNVDADLAATLLSAGFKPVEEAPAEERPKKQVKKKTSKEQ